MNIFTKFNISIIIMTVIIVICMAICIIIGMTDERKDSIGINDTTKNNTNKETEGIESIDTSESIEVDESESIRFKAICFDNPEFEEITTSNIETDFKDNNSETEVSIDEEIIISEETTEIVEQPILKEEPKSDNSVLVSEIKDTKPEIPANYTVSNNGTKYTIQNGDNWYTIATKYYGTGELFKALQKYNNIEGYIHAGMEIIIPSKDDPELIKINEDIANQFAKSLKEFQDSVKGTTIKAGTNGEYQYGTRMNPAVDITVPDGSDMKNYTEKVDTSGYELVGAWRITGYTPGCVHCCESAEGITASGVKAINGYTVAAGPSIPFGTTIYIEGYGYYVVEDRGPRDGLIDICCPTHDDCGPVTKRGVNVYIVPNN